MCPNVRRAGQDQPGCDGHGELAQVFLEGEGYILVDTQGNKASLVHSLLLLTHCELDSMLYKGVCAVVNLLEHEEVSKTAKVMAIATVSRINPLVNLMEH